MQMIQVWVLCLWSHASPLHFTMHDIMSAKTTALYHSQPETEFHV